MTPHQFWITQGKGMERPFTGDLWYVKDVGNYNCAICDSLLFNFDDKFHPPTGMASFWHHQKNSVEILENANDVHMSQATVNTIENEKEI